MTGRDRATGGVPAISVDAFGVIANAMTDTERARAVSASEAMPLMPSGAGKTFAQAVTTSSFIPQELRRGVGAMRQAYLESVGANLLPPLSHGISNVGGGPIAVSAAGQAVAVANADTPANDLEVLN